MADVRDGRGRELLSDYVFTARRQHPEELTHRDRLRTHLDTQATRIATLEAENERLQGVIESYDPRVRKAVETWMRGCNGFVPGNPKIAAAGVMRAFRALDDHPLKRTETTHAD